ncbi:MAG: hypothetical protein APR63_14785 [Desulfuromonas sp. SDB]|nr:MAG: hypothetical protein APR63_14785 [Desulfuromonas sp. SDB]
MAVIINKFFLILILGRLQFVFGGFLLFLFGSLLALSAGATFELKKFIIGYLIFFFAHLSVSYSNDYFDIKVDSFQKKTFFSGGSGVLVSYPELKKVSYYLSLALIALSVSLTIFSIIFFEYPIWFLLLVVAGNFLGWFYSAPPLKLSYRGYGDISTVLVIGILIPTMGFVVVNNSFSYDLLLMYLPMSLYGIAFIFSVHIPDLEADKHCSKRTMVTRIGRKKSFLVIGFTLVLSTIYFFLMNLFFPTETYNNFLILGILSLIPFTMGILNIVYRTSERKKAIPLVNFTMISFILFLLISDLYILLGTVHDSMAFFTMLLV